MAFKKIERRPSGKGNFSFDTVRVRSREKRVEITITDDIFKLMNLPTKLAIHLGTGAHAGKLMLEPDDSVNGYRLNVAHKRAITRVVCISRSKLGFEQFEPITVKHSLEGNQLTITLPRKKTASRALKVMNERAG
jgi:hypothetical protein